MISEDISRHALMAPSFEWISFNEILNYDIMDMRFGYSAGYIYYGYLMVKRPDPMLYSIEILENALILRENYNVDFRDLKVSGLFTTKRTWFEIYVGNVCANVFTYDFKYVHYKLDNGSDDYCHISEIYKKHPAFKWYNKFWHNFKLRYNLEF